jgi:hypothetical protein
MKDRKVQDLMLPLDEYTVVSEEARLSEVFLALEGALKGSRKRNPTEARDFAVLVVDQNKRVVGRLTVWDVLRGLEPQARRSVDPLAMVAGYQAWDRPLAQLASKAQNLQAKDLIKALSKDEYIDQEASLNEAVRRLVDKRLLSLIATRGRETVAILRVVDVFRYVCDELRSELG